MTERVLCYNKVAYVSYLLMRQSVIKQHKTNILMTAILKEYLKHILFMIEKSPKYT